MTFRFIILAAGKGSRMGANLPKALIPIGGKPILQHLHESVMESGVDGIPVVVVGHERAQLCEGFNGKCQYVVQEKQLGTAHAVQVCQEAVDDADAIIVLYGDHPFVSAQALRDLAELHKSSGGVLTMMTTTVPSFEAWENYRHWGRVLRDAHGHISAIREYKDAMESEREIKEVNPGLYCFNTKWLWENIGQIKNINASEEYYLTDLIELAVVQGHNIATMGIDPEESVGVNTPQELDIAERLLRERNEEA
jgi:bifunctional UDP-N-acetylglucosamine pyrophosphorylase / glucosamine-1-phosphate N-acetyltransferase